jgi:hypothetical protein
MQTICGDNKDTRGGRGPGGDLAPVWLRLRSKSDLEEAHETMCGRSCDIAAGLQGDNWRELLQAPRNIGWNRYSEPPKGILGTKTLTKEYFRLVWDDKGKGVVNETKACLPKEKGGLDCQDLATIVDASATALVIGATRPDLPWFQWFSATPKISSELRFAWDRWRRVNGAQFQGGVLLQLQPPTSLTEATGHLAPSQAD